VSSTRRPLKSLGQNFLVDNNIIDKIIYSAAIKPDDCVLEIGPGRGALTEYLARKAGRLVLIEYDHALAAGLKERYAGDSRVTVIDADILAVDLAAVLVEGGGQSSLQYFDGGTVSPAGGERQNCQDDPDAAERGR
jgi:16S rRNA (adenine1518-N6/adenine1519-N6)-dimethyltransferase